MRKYISLGKYNKNYKYILLYLVFRAFNDCIYGLEYKNLYKEIYFFGVKAKEFFNDHEMANTIFCYFVIIIFSLILIKYDSYIQKKNFFNKIYSTSDKSTQLIYNEPEDFLNYNKNRIYFNIFLVNFIWVIMDLLDAISKIDVNDFWAFKMVFVYFIGKKMLNIQIYKHQIFAIYFISIVCSLLLIISFILAKIESKNKETKDFRFILLGILIYFFNLLIDSFSDWKAKRVIDLKFISSSKLFLSYGILGIIIYTIVCMITTCFDYNKENYNNQDLFKFDNLVDYYYNLNTTNFFLMILYAITFALKSLFYLLTIEHLTPFHVISMPTFYLFFVHIVLGINTFINDNNDFKNRMIIILLEILACLFGLIAFSIFLEFIELNFCQCNYNLKRHIVQRSNKETNNNDNDDESIISEENKKEDDILGRELSFVST